MSNDISRYSSEFPFPEKAAREFILIIRSIGDRDLGGIGCDMRDALDVEISGSAEERQEAFENWITEHGLDDMTAQIEASYRDGKLWIRGENPAMANICAILSAVMEKAGHFGGSVWVAGPGRVFSESLEDAGKRIIREHLANSGAKKTKIRAPKP